MRFSAGTAMLSDLLGASSSYQSLHTEQNNVVELLARKGLTVAGNHPDEAA
jgi:hypothetical protein